MNDTIGTPYGPSRWFHGEPAIAHEPLKPVRSVWKCPQEKCDGEMEFNGFVWSTNPEGYHHTCTKCGFTAALKGKQYPTVEYLPDQYRARKAQER